MFNTLNITGLEMSAQFAEGRVFNRFIDHKPNVELVQVVYNGGGNFSYFVIGFDSNKREVSREFASDILTDEAKVKAA